MKKLIFVYGTLKSGFHRSNVLSSQRYIGVAKTVPHFEMYHYGTYPAMIEKFQSGTSVYGELYEVDDKTLAVLDEIECVSSNLFNLKQIELEEIFISNLPTDVFVADSLLKKHAFAYLFCHPEKLRDAKNCGSIWIGK